MRYPVVVVMASALIFLTLLTRPGDSLAAVPALSDRLTDCRTISEAVDRLACYDGIGLEVPAAAESSAVESTAAAEAKFGYEFSVKDAPEKLTSTVVSVRKNAKGGLVVTLANGQIWQQSGTERLFLDVGESVTIIRGAFSAFHLVVNDKGRRYRFARVD